MREVNNLHVVETKPLLSPEFLKHELPLSAPTADVVGTCRDQVRGILYGTDQRIFAVVGPCSIHDPDAALEYADGLKKLADRYVDDLLVVMRVYFEKPRTTTGWKGLISDPHLDGTHDMNTGLKMGRKLLMDVASKGLGAACEMLDPVTPQYLADLVAWGAIGARTTESQTHRMMASGLSMPIGFKNATDGNLQIAINAITAAAHPHHFLGISNQGQVSVVTTTGNGHCHLVLRGGSSGPNYDKASVQAASEQAKKAGLLPRVMVDCSHDNAQKNHENQPKVLDTLAEQVANGSDAIAGVMIESNLVAGKQSFPQPKENLVRGQSITDACVDLTSTESMLERMAQAVRAGKTALNA